MKWLGDSLKSLRTTNESMAEKIQNIELLVAGQYAKKDDLDKATTFYREALKEFSSGLSKQLQRIEDKLDNKADK